MPAPANLVHQQSTTTGTGNFTLSAVNGKQSFNSAFGNGVTTDVFDYFISNQGAAEWERGTGHMSASTTLVRDTVKESTNSNAAVSFSAGTKDVTCGAVAQTYLDALRIGFGLPMTNGKIVTSVASNILTVAIKTAAGNDPSALDPVTFYIRNATIATGDYAAVQVTSALSITTNATGASLGSTNSVPFRLWLCAFNNSGAVVLALWQSMNGTSGPAALNEAGVAPTTGISGSATSSGTFYTPNGTSLTSKAYRILGYLEYGSGLTTAGSYASTPTTIQLFGPAIKKPGDVVQTQYFATGAVATGTTQIPLDDTIPQNTEGDQYMSLAITPMTTCNLLEAEADAVLYSNTAANVLIVAMFQDSTANALAAAQFYGGGGATNYDGKMSLLIRLIAATVSSTTFKLRGGMNGAGTTTFNGRSGAREFGGVNNSYMKVTEYMT